MAWGCRVQAVSLCDGRAPVNRGGQDLGTVTTRELPECQQPTLCRSRTFPQPIWDLGVPMSFSLLPPHQEEVIPAWLRGSKVGEMPQVAPGGAGGG